MTTPHGYPDFRPGYPASQGDLRRMEREARSGNRAFFDGLDEFTTGEGGTLARLRDRPRLWARLTATDGLGNYSWEEVYREGGQSVPLPEAGGGLFGEYDGANPAREVAGRTDLAVGGSGSGSGEGGAVVVLYLDEDGLGWTFEGSAETLGPGTSVQVVTQVCPSFGETLEWVSAPYAPTSDGSPGQVALDDAYFYWCYGANAWARVQKDAWAGDAAAPTLSSATVLEEGDALALVFDGPVKGNAGFTLSASGGAVALAYSSGANTDALVYALSRVVGAAEELTLGYAPGDVKDLANNALAPFSGAEVTNESLV